MFKKIRIIQIGNRYRVERETSIGWDWIGWSFGTLEEAIEYAETVENPKVVWESK